MSLSYLRPTFYAFESHQTLAFNDQCAPPAQGAWWWLTPVSVVGSSLMWLKGCPRCHGDLFKEPALGIPIFATHYITCLQCGHVLSSIEERALVVERPPARPL